MEDLRQYLKQTGWDAETLESVLSVMEEIRSVKYELDNCVRGCYTGAATYNELKKSLRRLAEKFSEAVEDISDSYADRIDEHEYEEFLKDEVTEEE